MYIPPSVVCFECLAVSRLRPRRPPRLLFCAVLLYVFQRSSCLSDSFNQPKCGFGAFVVGLPLVCFVFDSCWKSRRMCCIHQVCNSVVPRLFSVVVFLRWGRSCRSVGEVPSCLVLSRSRQQETRGPSARVTIPPQPPPTAARLSTQCCVCHAHRCILSSRPG